MKKCDWYSLSQSSRTWLAVLLLTSLTACMGGGGGDGSDSPTTGDSKPASHTDGSNATPVGSSANPAGNPDTSTNAGTGTNTASAKWTYLVYPKNRSYPIPSALFWRNPTVGGGANPVNVRLRCSQIRSQTARELNCSVVVATQA